MTNLRVMRTNHKNSIFIACIQRIHHSKSWTREQRIAASKYQPVLMAIHEGNSTKSPPSLFMAFGGVETANKTVMTLFGKGRPATLRSKGCTKN